MSPGVNIMSNNITDNLMRKKSESTSLSEETRAALMISSTANLANALLKRGFRNTLMLGINPLSPGQPKMIGPAFTLRFIPSREDIDTMDSYCRDDNKHRGVMEICPKGSVLVIDAFGNTRASSMGDMMALRLKMRGVEGVVTDGGFRDIPAFLKIGLPAFQQRSAAPATPLSMHPLEWDVPIGCAGVSIYPGDIIVGDGDGVVVIPAYLVDEVAQEAAEAEKYEEFVAWHLERGRSLIGLFPANVSSREEYNRWVKEGRPELEFYYA